jgi:hypothetical protein
VKLLGGRSVRFAGSTQLVRLNLMMTSKPCDDFVGSIVAAGSRALAPKPVVAV